MNQERILILEDEVIVADDVLHCLEQAGYRVPLVCSTGEEALDALKSESVDLALIDIMLAGNMDGIETARTLRLNYRVPVIYLTSFTNQAMLERARETTPSGYIVKPFKKRELLATVEMALYPSGSSNAAATDSSQQRTGRTLAGTWESWLTKAGDMLLSVSNRLPGNAHPELEKLGHTFTKTAEQWREILKTTKSSELSLKDLFSLAAGIFRFLHPEVTVHIDCEPKTVCLNREPLFLIELLLVALDSCIKTDPQCTLRLEGRASNSAHKTGHETEGHPGSRLHFKVMHSNTASLSGFCDPINWEDIFSLFKNDCAKLGIKWASQNGIEEGVSGFTMQFPA